MKLSVLILPLAIAGSALGQDTAFPVAPGFVPAAGHVTTIIIDNATTSHGPVLPPSHTTPTILATPCGPDVTSCGPEIVTDHITKYNDTTTTTSTRTSKVSTTILQTHTALIVSVVDKPGVTDGLCPRDIPISVSTNATVTVDVETTETIWYVVPTTTTTTTTSYRESVTDKRACTIRSGLPPLGGPVTAAVGNPATGPQAPLGADQ